MLELGDVVGAGLHVSEAVPCVFGLVMSTNGHPLETIFSAVNIGNDTDTVAAMAGYIVGALNGAPPTTPIIMTRSRRPTISTCGRSHMRWRLRRPELRRRKDGKECGAGARPLIWEELRKVARPVPLQLEVQRVHRGL